VGEKSRWAGKREYGSIITHRHTSVMIWEIWLGVGGVS